MAPILTSAIGLETRPEELEFVEQFSRIPVVQSLEQAQEIANTVQPFSQQWPLGDLVRLELDCRMLYFFLRWVVIQLQLYFFVSPAQILHSSSFDVFISSKSIYSVGFDL